MNVFDLCSAFRTWARDMYDRYPNRFHVAHTTGHAIYFLLAFIEGHGMYAYASGALCIVTITALAVSE